MTETQTEKLRPLLAGRKMAMLGFIERLVNQNSFTDNREGGQKVGALLVSELGSIPGMRVRVIPSERFADHLVALNGLAEKSAAGGIAIVGHFDTVFPPGVFEGYRKDGDIARGPGVLDMKGGLTVAIEALRALSAIGMLERIPIRFVIVSDEEVGSPEGRPTIQDEVRGAACALVLEAGRAGDAIITARKGTGGLTAVAHGRAAHAGNAHASGANALWALARFIDRVQDLTDYDRGVTVNVGKVTGGHGKNTVPDRGEALVDFRFPTVEAGEHVLKAIREAADKAARSVRGTTIDVSGEILRQPLTRTKENVALYEEYALSAAAAGLGSGEAGLLGGGSDASSTAQIGIPSIDGLGPRGSGFHTKEELIEIESLVPKAEALARFFLGRIV